MDFIHNPILDSTMQISFGLHPAKGVLQFCIYEYVLCPIGPSAYTCATEILESFSRSAR